MKRILSILVVLSFVLTAPVFAEVHYTIDKLINKGAVEIVKAPVYFYDNTMDEIKKADNPAIGFLTSLLTSPLHVVKKVGEGSINMATFLVE